MAGVQRAQVLLAAAVLIATTLPSFVLSKDSQPWDVAGNFDQGTASVCRCWHRDKRDHCDCTQEGCSFVERLTMGSPDETGKFDVSISGVDRSCWNSSFGPTQMHVDSTGRILGGAHWESSGNQTHHNKYNETITHFDPQKLEQSMNMMISGNVFGFDGNPAGFRHMAIEYRNITYCETDDYLDGSCTPGRGRFVCMDKFSYCTGGPCFNENKNKLSPKEDAFFSRFSTTALNGTYVKDPAASSPDCPLTLGVFQYGSQIGIGPSRSDQHLASVMDSSMAWEQGGAVQFQTVCSGMQLDMDMAVAGEFKQVESELQMTIFLMLPWHDQGEIEVEKCVMRKVGKGKDRLFDDGTNHALVVVLVILLLLSVLIGGGLLALFLIFRRKYIETKIHRQYEIFQG